MQHQEAISVIRRLGPELTKEAAESVLLRYADERELAPAQLEKLAQTYNMVRQLSHIDRSEDRGSSCHQIDTPALVRSYVQGSEKAAATALIRVLPSDDADDVDLMTELNRELRSVEKAASCGCEQTPGKIEVTHPAVPAPSPEADVRYTPAQLKEAAWEAKVDLYMVADDILKMAKCEGRVLQLAEAELDASRAVNPVCVSESLNWLAKYAAQQKLSREISRHEGPIKPTAFEISTPLSKKVEDLAEAFTVTSLFHKIATDVGVKMEDMPQSGRVLDPSADAMASMFDKLEAVEPEIPVGAAEEPRGFAPPADEREPKEEPEGKGGKGGKGGGGKDGKGGKPGAERAGGHWLAAIISGATKPVSAAAGAVDSAAAGARGTLQAVTGKERVHKEQLKLDNDIQDIKRSILIRRLAASDPVLREMPIQQVLETYNAIAESNPEVATNPRRVLLAMREAASYEGITLDSQKLLGDVRGAAAKTDAAEHDNKKRRYSA